MELTARELMTAEVVTVPRTLPVEAIAQLLAAHGITCAPVVDGKGACWAWSRPPT